MLQIHTRAEDGSVKYEKMSKSLGNVVTIRDFLREHDADILRLIVLSGYYRNPLLYGTEIVADQERKLAQSGLGEMFDAIEIVSDKSPDTYARIFSRHGTGPGEAMMVGNSLRSDIVPAIDAGAWGTYVPHDLTWAYERVEAPAEAPRFRQIEHVGELAGLLREIE